MPHKPHSHSFRDEGHQGSNSYHGVVDMTNFRNYGNYLLNLQIQYKFLLPQPFVVGLYPFLLPEKVQIFF